MSLVKAFEEAKSASTRTHEFDIAGETISLPRLNLKNQARFEKWMKGHTGEDFSLATTSNRAAYRLANTVEKVREELLERDDLDGEASEELRREIKAKAREGIEPYLVALLEKIDTSAQVHSIYLAFKQGFGATYTDDDGEFEVSEDNVSRLLEQSPANTLSNGALYVLGLLDLMEEIGEKAEQTGREVVEDSLPDPTGSGSQPSEKSTTKTPSPSSPPTTEKNPTGHGS